MHPNAVQNVTRKCNQTFVATGQRPATPFANPHYDTHFRVSKKLFTNTASRLSLIAGTVRASATRLYTSFSLKNKSPFSCGVRKIFSSSDLAHTPNRIRHLVASSRQWLRHVLSHALSFFRGRVWGLPLYFHCSPPHVR